MNFMLGITFSDWKKLLKENEYSLDPANYFNAVRITLFSIANSRMRRKENKIYSNDIARTEILDPIFILGHWRSGTTLIHKLLSLDEQFAFPNLFQITHPHSFLYRERAVEKALGSLQSEKRPMDNMKVTFRDPGEDESALSVMCQRSPLVGWGFPENQLKYAEYHTFENTNAEDLERWKEALIWFYKKLTYRYGKPLILKSPVHTARVKILLDMFPNAKFIHMYRNPYEVFLSTKNLYAKMLPLSALQKVNLDKWDSYIIENYSLMYRSYFKHKNNIPKDNLIEFSFERFENEKIKCMKEIYDKFDLKNFNLVESKLNEYFANIKDYKKNKYSEIDEKTKKEIEVKWKFAFDEMNYLT